MSNLASRRQLRVGLLRWVLVTVPGCVLLGLVSAALSGSGSANAWYAALVKPAINPPPIVFPVVWTLLYSMMGLALALVLSSAGARGRGRAVIVFALQLLANLAWSPLFFAGHRIVWALGLLLLIDGLVAVSVVFFARVRPVAGALLVPYLAWVLFATVLNWQFWVHNPQADGAAGAPQAVVHLRIGA